MIGQVIILIAVSLLAALVAVAVVLVDALALLRRRELLRTLRRLPMWDWTAAQWQFVTWLLFLVLLISLSFNAAILFVFLVA